MSKEAAQTESTERPVNPRQQFMDELTTQFETNRAEELAAALEVDPDLKHTQEQREAEMQSETPEEGDDGLETYETASEESEPEAEAEVELETESESLDESQPEVLAGSEDIITRDDGVYMRTVVDGEEDLIPISRAREILQKNIAADHRLEHANRLLADINIRERALRQRESELSTQPLQATDKEHLPPSAEGVDDEALKGRAKDLVQTLFTSDDEDQAVEKLLEVMRSVRPQERAIDEQELEQKLTTSVMQQLNRTKVQEEVNLGYRAFERDFPEIVADSKLFNAADSIADEIVAQNPGMPAGQVMRLAGERTREWLSSLSNDGVEKADKGAAVAETHSDSRQSRKERLTPMPRSTAARYQPEPEEKEQSPSDVLREMREARGQPA